MKLSGVDESKLDGAYGTLDGAAELINSLPTHEGRGWSLAALATGNSLEFLGGAGKVAP